MYGTKVSQGTGHLLDWAPLVVTGTARSTAREEAILEALVLQLQVRALEVVQPEELVLELQVL